MSDLASVARVQFWRIVVEKVAALADEETVAQAKAMSDSMVIEVGERWADAMLQPTAEALGRAIGRAVDSYQTERRSNAAE